MELDDFSAGESVMNMPSSVNVYNGDSLIKRQEISKSTTNMAKYHLAISNIIEAERKVSLSRSRGNEYPFGTRAQQLPLRKCRLDTNRERELC